MNTIKVAILGLGTVGTGVYKLIQKRADVMERTAGAKLEVKKILVRNMQKKREGVEQELLTDNWKEILEDDEISVVIEVMGGLEPAKTMILEALDIPVFLDCDMCLGEGTGAVTIYPILDMALAVYGGMCTFSDNQMENYVPLV